MDSGATYETFFAIGNYLAVTADLPIEIVPGYVFDHANAEEIGVINSRLEETDLGNILIRLYQKKFSVSSDQHIEGSLQSAESAILNNHYYVIRTTMDRDNAEIDQIRCTSHAMPQDGLETFFRQTSLNGVFAGSSYPAYLDLLTFHRPAPALLNGEYFRRIKDTHARLQMAKTSYPSIYRSVGMFDELRAVPRWSSLFVLGLFSVIESLLTHAPEPKDPTDSLTRQIISKSRLLNNRFVEYIDMAAPFNVAQKASHDGKHKTIWQALYGYRSAVAHGSLTRTNDLAILKNIQNANEFLYRFTKALLQHALTEPVLILDLQAC